MSFTDWRVIARRGTSLTSETAILTMPRANTNAALGVYTFNTIYTLFNNVCVYIDQQKKNTDVVSIPNERLFVIMYNIHAVYGKHADRNIHDIMREIMDMSAFECTLDPAFRLFFLMHTYTLDIKSIMMEAHALNFTGKTVITKKIMPGVAGSEIVDGAPCCSVDFLIGRQSNGMLHLISAKLTDVPIYTHDHVRTRILHTSKNLSIEYEEPLFDVDEYEEYMATLGEFGIEGLCAKLPDDAPDLAQVLDTATPAPAPPPITHCTNITTPTLTHNDIATLNTLEFTDNVLQFFVLSSLKRLAILPKNVYVFNSQLMQFMCTTKTPYDALDDSIENIEKQVTHLFGGTLKNYGTVPSRTNRNERVSCLIDKEFVLIPSNSAERGGKNRRATTDRHWVLYIVYRPFEAETAPLIFVVDTLYNIATQSGYMTTDQHARNMMRLRRYFTLVAEKYLPATPRAVSTTRKSCFLPCPQQPPNSNACGAYISMYITIFLSHTPEERADFLGVMKSSERRRTGPVLYDKQFREIPIDQLKENLIAAVKKDFNEKNKKIVAPKK